MNLAERLLAEANAIVESVQKDLAQNRLEQSTITASSIGSAEESRLAVVDREIRLATTASNRLKDYEPKMHRPLNCPYCWIMDGKRIVLRPVPGSTHAVHCWNCQAEYGIEL